MVYKTPSEGHAGIICILWGAWALFAVTLGSLGGALGLPWGALGLLRDPLGLPCDALDFFGRHWVPSGVPLGSLRVLLGFFCNPWVSLGSPGRLFRQMWLKYCVCAQVLA